jgi:response regulator NasT
MTQPIRIAVADDEPDMRDFYVRVLPRLGHEVVAVAATGTELLAQCRSAHPDLVITDVRMPDLDGLEAVSQLCENEPVAVLLVTAHPSPELLRRTETGEVLGYLIKPIRLTDLAPAITRAMQRFQERHS